jgi:eukaryotic-like serine/threonine-protein kinase
MMDDQNRCRGCGQTRPPDAPAGLCPVCLFRAGQNGAFATDDDDVDTDNDPIDPIVPASLTELLGVAGSPDDSERNDSRRGGELSGRSGRLQVFGPIGRGGMGVVLKGRDNDLGRELAVKVLLDRYCDHPAMVRRFIEEAQIGGQLQHPGVVPVYEIGILSDRRPYFAMKLIKGRTLAELLTGRSHAEENLPRLLSIFEAVCQTVAYAHARGVIHRDLKPSNIMVGSFGEVQVMDWGAAKVLSQRDEQTDVPVATGVIEETIITTGRSHAEKGYSRAGTVIGTPAYMAPEQARGDIDAIDERADVFALGSILCEVLTGRPGYLGTTSFEIEQKAARGDLVEAYARLETCGVDAELIALARDSLAVEPADRPRDARVAAERITAYRAGVSEKLRAAELATVEARARADEETKRRGLADRLADEAIARATLERRRRRLSLALAGTILTLIVVCASAAVAFIQERQARMGRVDLVLSEADLLYDQAIKDPEGDLGKWQSARAALDRARELMAAVPLAAARDRIDGLADRIDQGGAAALVDRQLVSRLEDVRAGLDTDQKADAAYTDAFRAAGLDLVAPTVDPVAVGKRLAARPREITRAAAGALDAWALVRRGLTSPGDAAGWAVFRNLLAVARAADPDPWRDALHDSLSRSDPAPLIQLAGEPGLEQHDPIMLWFLGYGLEVLGEHDRALDVLTRARRAHPGDFWLNTELGLVCMGVKRSGPAATSSLIATGAISPGTKAQDAETFFTAAIALRPRFASAHHLLGAACQLQGKWEQAIACYREGIRLQPDDATVYNSLANVYVSQSKTEQAIAAYREAIRLKPGYDLPYTNLLAVLGSQGRFAEAVSTCRDAIRLAPEVLPVHVYLGDFLLMQGRLDEATAAYEAARQRIPANPQLHDHLGNALFQQGKLDRAVTEYREAIRLAPGSADAHAHLAQALINQGKLDLGIETYREAIALAPQLPAPHVGLGAALRRRGDYTHAAAELRTAFELATDPVSRETIQQELARTKNWQALAKESPAEGTGDDSSRLPAENLDRAYYYYEQQHPARAARLFNRALDKDPGLIGELNNQNQYNAACACALAAAGQGRGEPAPSEADKTYFRQRARDYLKADLTRWLNVLGNGSQPNAAAIRQTFQHWKADPDLASVRDPGPLAKLPELERKEWVKLWERLDAALTQPST